MRRLLPICFALQVFKRALMCNLNLIGPVAAIPAAHIDRPTGETVSEILKKVFTKWAKVAITGLLVFRFVRLRPVRNRTNLVE